jgi:hypothetical protein
MAVPQTPPTAVPARTTDPRQTTPTLAPPPPQPAPGMPKTTTITPENTLRSQRLEFAPVAREVSSPTTVGDVKTKGTQGSVQKAFNAAQPQMMQQFKDESKNLVQRTAAMGRTGSGLFNQATGFVGDRALQARDALFGNLTFQATQADAGRALQAAMGNQQAGMAGNSLAAQMAMANANNAMNVDMARQAHYGQQQSREDMLASSAMENQRIQAMLLGEGFQNTPTGAIGMAANTALAAGENYGANAAAINAQQGGAWDAMGQWAANQGGSAAPVRTPVDPRQSYAPGQTAPNPALLQNPDLSRMLPRPTANWNINAFPQGDASMGRPA